MKPSKLSTSQDSLYWRQWAAVVRTNNWRWIKSRIIPEAVRDRSEHHSAVWKIAGERALQQHRAMTADDLRHACHIYALSRDVSHSVMSNAAFSRLLCLWGDGKKKLGLLIEPDCLESRMHWDDKQLSALERTKAFIGGFPPPYVAAICSDRFGTKDWQSLEPDRLRQLSITLSERGRAQMRKAPPPIPQLDPDNAPY